MGFARQRRILSWILGAWPRRSSRRNPVEEVHAFFAERLTRSGKAVAGLWLGSLFPAMLPGQAAATLLFALLSAVLLLSLALTLRAPRLRATRLGQGRAVAGTRGEWRVRLENLSPRPVEWAGAGLFRPREGLGASAVEALAETIPGGRSVDLVLRAACLARGPTGFLGLGVVRRDPLGLARSRSIDFTPVEVLVAPAPLRVAWSRFLFQGASGRAFAEATGQNAEADRILHGVRPFRDGDRLRDLDHKSWARWNRPIVREFGTVPPRGIALAVETCCDTLFERSLLEPTIRLAAGIADRLCRDGVLARLVVDGAEAGVRCDDPDQVGGVFAALPRCGFGRWPGSERAAAWNDPSICVLRVGACAARARAVDIGTLKRIAVTERRPREEEDPDLAWVEVASLGTGEVVL